MERANRGGGRPMLNGDANERWKLYRDRDRYLGGSRTCVLRMVKRRRPRRKLMDMIAQRTVHVTGATIELYRREHRRR